MAQLIKDTSKKCPKCGACSLRVTHIGTVVKHECALATCLYLQYWRPATRQVPYKEERAARARGGDAGMSDRQEPVRVEQREVGGK